MTERLQGQSIINEPELTIEELLVRRARLQEVVKVNGGSRINSTDHPLYELLPPGLQKVISEGSDILLDTLANHQIQNRQNPSEK